MRQPVIYALMFVWMVLAPLRPALGAVAALPLLDLALGLIAAYRGKRPLTGAGIKRTVAKVCLYEVATILAFIVEMYMTGPFIPCIKMVTGLIGCTELKSCLEHLDELGGQPFFASIITKLAPPKDRNDQV
jgi:hypothetical protein